MITDTAQVTVGILIGVLVVAVPLVAASVLIETVWRRRLRWTWRRLRSGR